MSRFVFALLLLLTATLARAEPPDGYDFIDFGSALKRAQAENKPVFVYFGRVGCPWCDRTNKESFSQADVKQRYQAHYVLAYIDTENSRRITLPSGEHVTEMDLASRYRVIATPFFVFVDAGGKPLLRAPGFKTARELTEFDDFIAGKHYQTQSLSQFLSGKK